MKEIISLLKAQSSLKVDTPRESTQKKIQEIEEITREIKKCLGISIDQNTSSVDQTTSSVDQTVDKKSVDQTRNVDKTRNEKTFEKSDSTSTLKEEESLQEMSSELMNMFVSFGF